MTHFFSAPHALSQMEVRVTAIKLIHLPGGVGLQFFPLKMPAPHARQLIQVNLYRELTLRLKYAEELLVACRTTEEMFIHAGQLRTRRATFRIIFYLFRR